MEEAWEGSSEEVTKRRSQCAKVWRGQCFGQRGLQVQSLTGGNEGLSGDHLGRCDCSGGSEGERAQGELGGVGTGPLDQLSEPWLFLKVVLPGARPIPAGAGT